jgi:hypothetical protein
MKRDVASVTRTKSNRLQTRRMIETPCDRWLGSCNSFWGDLSVEVWKW